MVKQVLTRMHSSRMCTAGSLTMGGLSRGEGVFPGGVPCDLLHHAFDFTCMLPPHQMRPTNSVLLIYCWLVMGPARHAGQAWIQGGPRGPGPTLTLGFEAPKLSIFALLCSAYYFFNMLLFKSSNSKIFQPRFARHMISHLQVFVFSLSFTHFRLLGVHLSLSCF